MASENASSDAGDGAVRVAVAPSGDQLSPSRATRRADAQGVIPPVPEELQAGGLQRTLALAEQSPRASSGSAAETDEVRSPGQPGGATDHHVLVAGEHLEEPTAPAAQPMPKAEGADI